MSVRVKLIIAAIGLVAVAVATPFAWGYVSQWLRVSLDAGEDQYAGVTVVHRQLPPSTVPDEWAARLEKQVGHDLGLEVRQDWRPNLGDGPWASADGFKAAVGKRIVLPDPAEYRVMGVVTNAHDKKSVAAWGTLYLVWFQTPVDADSWVTSDGPVFTDAAAEDDHTTWWAGFDVVNYAPPAEGTDLTEKVDGWVRSVTACPNETRGCTVPEHIATAGVTPSP